MFNEMMIGEELFHTPTGVAFADLITDGHRETWPIRSKSFRNWVRRCHYQATGAAAGAAVIGAKQSDRSTVCRSKLGYRVAD
jgi:hypothetical protein